jgi:hypothetical protein
MSNPSRFWQASYETEASWAVATNTFGTRIQLVGPPELNLVKESIPVPIAQQYSEEGIANVPGTYSGSTFSITTYLTGHGGVTTGSLTASELYTLLVNFFGAGNAAQVGSTVDSATDEGQYASAGATVVSRMVHRVGDLADGRGEGTAVATSAAGTITLLTDLPGTPSAGDVVYAMLNVFPDENPGSIGTVASTRWNLMSANNQWYLRGCFPLTAEFAGLNHGEIPTVKLTYGVSRWLSKQSDTFPDVTATAAKTVSPIVMGSVFANTVDTPARVTYSLRNWDLTINQEVQPIMGPGGTDDFQTVIGATRIRSAASFNMTFDAEAAGTETWADKWDASALQHVLVHLSSGDNAADGKQLAFYFVNCRLVGNRPTQEDGDGLNRVSVSMEALTGNNVASAGNMASWRLAMG